jgi:hypothetical protein
MPASGRLQLGTIGRVMLGAVLAGGHAMRGKQRALLDWGVASHMKLAPPSPSSSIWRWPGSKIIEF